MEFSDTLKKVRMKLNISQERLARDLSVSFATINRWENSKCTPNLLTQKVFYSYCKEKGLEYLLNEEDSHNKAE